MNGFGYQVAGKKVQVSGRARYKVPSFRFRNGDAGGEQ